jgi:hypothetical protein
MATTSPKIIFQRFVNDKNMTKGSKDARPINLFPASLEHPRLPLYRVLVLAGPLLSVR